MTRMLEGRAARGADLSHPRSRLLMPPQRHSVLLVGNFAGMKWIGLPSGVYYLPCFLAFHMFRGHLMVTGYSITIFRYGNNNLMRTQSESMIYSPLEAEKVMHGFQKQNQRVILVALCARRSIFCK